MVLGLKWAFLIWEETDIKRSFKMDNKTNNIKKFYVEISTKNVSLKEETQEARLVHVSVAEWFPTDFRRETPKS